MYVWDRIEIDRENNNRRSGRHKDDSRRFTRVNVCPYHILTRTYARTCSAFHRSDRLFTFLFSFRVRNVWDSDKTVSEIEPMGITRTPSCTNNIVRTYVSFPENACVFHTYSDSVIGVILPLCRTSALFIYAYLVDVLLPAPIVQNVTDSNYSVNNCFFFPIRTQPAAHAVLQ